jgi:16S rRNA (adenine1518-N6/adenine1519-N6)-dimethyltransferase
MSSVLSIMFDEQYHYPLRNERIFREITGAAFRMRRKMVRNTMIPYMVSKGITETEAKSILADAGIDPVSRPETLGVAQFVAVSNGLGSLLARCVYGENEE